MQSTLVTIYGFYQWQLRFMSAQEVLKHVAPRAAGKALDRKERLRELINHAVTHVPFYRNIFAGGIPNLNTMTESQMLDLFPVLNKADVKDKRNLFCSDTATRWNSLTLSTSGTTGSPLKVLSSKEARRKNYYHYNQLLKRYGANYRSRSVTFAGRPVVSRGEKKEFWRKDWFTKTLYCSSFHLSSESMGAYITAMEAWQPDYIDSYPSAIGLIAKYINEEAILHRVRPKLVLTSSESLSQDLREHIERAFSCKVVDQYGCAEMAVFAHSDGECFLVDQDYGIVEFEPIEVLPDGKVLSSVVCTGLLNHFMPLIRYRIGDCVIHDNGNHHRTLEKFYKLVGREDDLIRTPEGRLVGRLDPIFKGLENIRSAQIIQHTVDSIEIVLVKEREDDPVDEIKLSSALRDRTSPLIKVDFKYVSDIEKTSSGKFRAVISKL